MKTVLKNIYNLLGSKALTFWMIGLFIFYYLTVAVWSKEAFGRFIQYISSNNLARALYIIFFVNVTLRIIKSLYGLKNRPGRLLLRLPLFLGIVLFLFSSFMSVNTRQSKWELLGEGDLLVLPWESLKFRVVRIESALKRDLLRMDDSLLFDYEPFITLIDTGGRQYRIGAFPPKKAGTTYMHILNFGLAPGVELRRDGKTLLKGEVALRLVPFGSVDSFELKGFNYTVYLHILPNRIIRRGQEVARNYDITAPLYQVEVLKGETTVFRGTSKQPILFDGYELVLYPPTFWVLLEVAHDPFYMAFIVALGLLIVGVVPFLISFLHKKAKA